MNTVNGAIRNDVAIGESLAVGSNLVVGKNKVNSGDIHTNDIYAKQGTPSLKIYLYHHKV
jgi:hypothetical protein